MDFGHPTPEIPLSQTHGVSPAGNGVGYWPLPTGNVGK